MRLLVVTNLFYPDRGGGASVFSDMCFGLAEKGWDVTVFTTYPYYPEWRRKGGVSPWRVEHEVINRVEVWRHGIYIPSKPSNLVQRIVYELSFAASLLQSLGKGGRYDVVMVYCPMLGGVLSTGIRTCIYGEPLWLNVQDIPADAAAASGISKSRLFNNIAQRVQRMLFNRARVWSTISPVMVKRLASMRAHNQPLHLCPNWLNDSLAKWIDQLPPKVGRPPQRPLQLLYAGNIGKKQGLVEFCRLLAATTIDFKFIIHGNGGESETVRNWVSHCGSPRFEFGEFLDEAGFAKALGRTDVFVITEKSGSGASFIPSKLIPAIASASPILAICDLSGPLGNEISEGRLGICVEWGTPLEGALASLSDAKTLNAFQSNCLNHSVRYRREFGINRLDQLLRQMEGGRTSGR